MTWLHEETTFGSQTLRALRRFPDRVAFSTDDVRVTYSHVLDVIGALQGVFIGLNPSRGGGVAILSANRWRAGAVVLLPRYRRCVPRRFIRWGRWMIIWIKLRMLQSRC